jgi:serine/threonine protein kinase
MDEAEEGLAAGERWEGLRRRLRRNLWKREYQEALLPPEGTEVGGLRLEARLGAGSYGTVYRARRGGRRYAVKFIYLPSAEEWGWRELEVLLRLRRVGAVRLEGHGLWPDQGPFFLYLVMEYVRGLPLHEWARRSNPTARQVARLVGALARQLGAVHAAGVVHRDVKGANVLVRAEDGRPVLVDFGMGTWPGAMRVTGPVLPGTALYRGPEALRFRRQRQPGERYEATHRDDLWALGVLLYWLLTGSYPFGETDEEALEDAILHETPEAPHRLNPRVPPALAPPCLRLLEKAPEARYPDAAAVAEALEAELLRAEGDLAWDAPLCEAWGPDNATTPVEAVLGLDEGLARLRRLGLYERRHPRRGHPADPDPPSSPGAR